MIRKSMITLLIGILVIVALSFVFFNYIGSEPTFQPKNTTDQIAIVNEDAGYEQDDTSDPVTLGEDLVKMIQDGESGYEWPTVIRNRAQEGIENKEYDAVIYIPSTFSADIMSFKDTAPSVTNIRYEMSPHLNAKNQERVQKELEAAQQQLNGRVTAMYWRYVSEEVHGVQTNFDEIVDKEVNFLNEMHAFYAPSSKELGEEIDRQRERISRLFVNSDEATGIAGNSQNNLEEAQKSFETLTENIDTYLKYQDELTTTLLATDSENEKLVNDAATEFQALLQQGEQNIREGQEPFQPKLDNTGENVLDYLQTWNENTHEFGRRMNEFSASSNTHFLAIDTEVDNLPTYGRQAIAMYNRNVNSINFVDARAEAKAMREGLIQEQGNNGRTRPEEPEGLESLDDDFLAKAQAHVQSLKPLLETLKPEEKVDPSPPPIDEDEDSTTDETESETDESNRSDEVNNENDAPRDAWREATGLLGELETELTARQTNIEEIVPKYVAYMEQISGYITYLEAHVGQDVHALLNEIYNLEKRIVERDPHRSLAPLPIDEPIKSRNVRELTQYHASLARLDLWLGLYLSDQINNEKAQESVEKHLTAQDLREKITASKENTSSFMERYQDIEKMKEFSEGTQAEFNQLMQDTNEVLRTLEQDIAEQQQFVRTELSNTLESARNVDDTLRNGRVALEVEAGPIEGLDGNLVQASQQSSLSEIEQLGQSVQSLGEYQDDLIGSTEDMFKQVSSVQNKSDDLNERWKNSVDTTKLVHGDMNAILGNAINDGYYNDSVYKHLSNPVNVAGDTQVEGPSEPFTPPVVMLVVILLVSLLIGYLAHHYGHLPIPVHLSLYGILSIALGLIISIYGLSIYTMTDAQSIQWTIITVLLVLATTGVIRLLHMVGPWMGALGSVVVIFLFTAPLLDMALPNFNSANPIAELFMSIQHKEQKLFVPGTVILAAITCLAVAIPVVKHIREKQKLRAEDEEYEA
ncbi:type VII secretion protein EsaA [Bacillus sp. FSL W7-1360]